MRLKRCRLLGLGVGAGRRCRQRCISILRPFREVGKRRTLGALGLFQRPREELVLDAIRAQREGGATRERAAMKHRH